MGFERGVVGGGQILGFSIDLRRRPYNTVRVCALQWLVLVSLQSDAIHKSRLDVSSAIASVQYFTLSGSKTMLYPKRDFVSETTSGQMSSPDVTSEVAERRNVGQVTSLWHVILNIVAQALIFISSCCNPFIYYISSKNFRESLQSIFSLFY